MPLRVVTYNIWGVGTPHRYWRDRAVLRGARAGSPALAEADEPRVWRRRAALLTRALADADADLVALQEVPAPAGSGGGRARELADALPGRWEVAHSEPGPTPGLAVLSRGPVDSCRVFPVPGFGGFGGHPDVLEVSTPAVTVWVTHLPVGPDEAKEACLRGLEAAAAAAPPERPLLVCGDLNCPADGALMGRLRDRGALVDAWAAAGGPPAALTMPVPTPTWRLDHVLVRATDPVRATRPALLGTACDDSGQYPSDHFGVALSLDLGAPAPGPSDLASH
ncbi:endonuclease/exonuclease/phosphatase family protein [Micromonospora carbonacea]|uniref:Endonuclease/exonuclease/phosphatase family protein n=1 Tax=Micromonospora carbonacea TaxID=47853 RepID=A0A7H8XN68_9ACTN|nr:endonuclease/exonuclease/phosphatase family protein [Micromonospora carbonacea]MBB5827082.1 endonuclease/exonuclease/phosphatase family metal-dependent hydrolase [Micromonospora carbonacea]QLD25101.1 endonuclease/exonuclease/phosphatase family protein [Micromonospora carbonacea]